MTRARKHPYQSGREVLSKFIPGYVPPSADDRTYDIDSEHDCADQTVKTLLGSFVEKVHGASQVKPRRKAVGKARS